MLPMVVVAVLWSFVYNPDFGLVNGALKAVGLEDWTRVWLGDPSTALLAICVVSGWVFAGFYMTIFYAAFRRSPPRSSRPHASTAPNESTCSGASGCPIIRNSIEVAILLCVTGGFQSLRPLLRPHQRRPLPLDRDPHDLPRAVRVPHRRKSATAPRWPSSSPPSSSPSASPRPPSAAAATARNDRRANPRETAPPRNATRNAVTQPDPAEHRTRQHRLEVVR